MVTLDTSGLLAVTRRNDPSHDRATSALLADPGPYLIPTGILAEASYLLEREFGAQLLDVFLDDLITGKYLLDCGERDLPRIRALVNRFADLPLGFADAAVIACAERNGGRVLTLDLRHFGVVAREGTMTIPTATVG